MSLKQQEQQDPTESSYNSLVGSLISDSMHIDNEKVSYFLYFFVIHSFLINKRTIRTTKRMMII
jgi:hypothetical protein